MTLAWGRPRPPMGGKHPVGESAPINTVLTD
jgi:hypothetical protein